MVFVLFAGCSSKSILDRELFIKDKDNTIWTTHKTLKGKKVVQKKEVTSRKKEEIKYNAYILKNTSENNRDLFVKFLEKRNHYKKPYIVMSETTIEVPVSLGKLESREFNIENQKLEVKIFDGNNITIRDIQVEIVVEEDEAIEKKPSKKTTPKTEVEPLKKIVPPKPKIKKKLVVVDNSEYFSKYGLSAKIKSEVKKLLKRGNTDIIILSSSGTTKNDDKKLYKLDYSGTANRFILSQFSNIIKDGFSDKYSHITYFTGMKVTSKPSANKVSNMTMFRGDGGKIEIRTISSNCSKLGVYVNGCKGF